MIGVDCLRMTASSFLSTAPNFEARRADGLPFATDTEMSGTEMSGATPLPNQVPGTQYSAGVGSSWEAQAATQAVFDQAYAAEETPISRLMPETLSANPPILADLLSSLPAQSRMDPLGGREDFATQPASVATAMVPEYPGYLLRYEPGQPLERRPAVAQWQAQMRQRGWRLAVDGFYGPESELAALQFQREKGLIADGVVGLQTWRAAFDNSTITGGGERENEIEGGLDVPYPGRLLRYNPFETSRFDLQAQQVQQRLQALGWRIETDGRYGPRSERAIALFQQQANLDADGSVGPSTWAALFDADAPLAPREQDLTPLATTGRINRAGLDLIKSFEGLRLNAYQDAVGVWTIGYGHTRTAAPGQRITLGQATALLRDDVATFERAVTRAVRVPITENQFAALVSFAYNVGSGALNSSTLLRRLNAGDVSGAADEFLRWNRAGGRVLAGLTRRRVAERALFLS